MRRKVVLLLPEESSGLEQALSALTTQQLVDTPVVVAAPFDAESERIRVLGEIAAERLERVQVIALRIGSLPTAKQLENEISLATWIRQSCEASGVEFTSGVIADSSVTSLHRQHFHLAWDYNLIIEPTDSVGETGFLSAPLHSGLSHASLVATTALASGMFPFLNEGVLDDWTESRADNILRIRLTRSHIRIVDTRDLVSSIVTLALSEGTSWHLPEGCVSHPRPVAAVTELATKFCAAFNLNSQVSPEFEQAARSLGFFASLRFFLAKCRQIVGRRAEDLAERELHVIEQRISALQDSTSYGSSSELRTICGKPNKSDATPLAHAARVDSAKELDPLLPNPTPAASTWEATVNTITSLVDGGPLPEPLEQHYLDVEGQRGVIAEPSTVVALDAPLLELSNAECKELRLSDSGFDVDPHDGTTVALLHQRVTTLESREGVNFKNLKTKIISWAQKRPVSFARSIADHLGSQTMIAATVVEDVAREWDSLKETAEAARSTEASSRFTLRNTAVMSTLLVVGGIVAFFVSFAVLGKTWGSNEDGIEWLFIIVCALVGISWLTLTLAATVNAARRQHKAETSLLALQALPQQLADRRRQALEEYVRLSSLSAQFADWAAALAVVIHEPYGPRQVSATDPSVALKQHPLKGLAVATPAVRQEQMGTQALAVRRRVVIPGWLNKAFEKLSHEVRLRYALLTEQPVPQIKFEEDQATVNDLIPIPGTAEHVQSPRRQLRTELEERRHADTARQALIDSLSDFTASELSDLVSNLDSSVSDLSNRNLREFIDPLAHDSYNPRFSKEYLVESVTPDRGSVEESWSGSTFSSFDTNRQDKLVQEGAIIASYRLQLSPGLEPEELRLIDKPDPHDEPDHEPEETNPDDVG